jgi:hypothetical protein
MHNIRVGRSVLFLKKCGALAGMLIVSPALRTRFSPRKVNSTSSSRMVNISSEIVTMGTGTAAGRDMHINETVVSGGFFTRQQNGVGVSHQPDVGQIRIVRSHNREISLEVIGGNRRDGLRRIVNVVVHYATPFSGVY